MRRLICTFVVRMWQKQVFSWCGSSTNNNVHANKIYMKIEKLCIKKSWRPRILWLVKVRQMTVKKQEGYKTIFFSFFLSILANGRPRSDATEWGMWSLPTLFATVTETYVKKNKNKMSHVMRKPVYALCEQLRHISANAAMQSDQHLCYSLPGWYNTSTFYSQNFKTLDGLISWAGRFESYLVGNPEDRSSRDRAQINQTLLTIIFPNFRTDRPGQTV